MRILKESLPESVTKCSSRLSSKQRMANLNADRQAIERALTVELGLAARSTHFVANPVNIVHEQDALGNRKVTQAVMIVPTSDDSTGLEQSIALRHGAFVDVENPKSFVVASRKEATRARRELMQGWSFDSKMVSCKYNNTSVVQGQLGEKTLEILLRDFVKTCTKKVLLVNDMVAGIGETALAALGARLSDEARENGVRLCYWGFEFRKSLLELAAARAKTALGQAYVDGKLQAPGMTPSPVPRPPSLTRRESIHTLLQKPLQRLTVDAEGNLVLPPLTSLPVTVNEELKALWKSVRAEFPYPDERPAKKSAVGGAETDKKKDVETTETTATAVATAVAAGTKWPDRAALVQADWVVLQESPSAIPGVTLLLAKKNSGGDMHVFLENSCDANIKVKGGTFVGRAGDGSFYPVQEAPPAQAAYTWTYTRLTEYKKDTAKLASGSVVWSEKGPSVGDSSAVGSTPTMMTLESIEKVLGEAALGATKCIKVYGHATTKTSKTVKVLPCDKPCIVWSPHQSSSAGSEFTADTFGKWLCSREQSAVGDVNVIECKGVLRPCFEVTWVAMATDKMLKPVSNNPLCLFTINPMMLAAKEVVSL